MIFKFFKKANIFLSEKDSLENRFLNYFTLFFIPIGLIFILIGISFFIYYNIYDFSNFFKLFLFSLIFLIFLIIFLRYILSFVIKKVVIDRINDLTNEMLKIKNQEFSKKRFEIKGIDELDKLLYTSNLVFDKYDSLIELEKKHSLVDPLTLAFNRRALNLNFDSFKEKALREKKEISVLMFDIDDFKHFNDTYGHDIGDDVLKKISSISKNIIRKYDTFYRIGGEEFLVLFYDLKKNEVDLILRRIKEQITYQLSKDCKKVESKITISGGFVTSSNFKIKDDNILPIMIKSADELLYQAKREGKNKILYDL